MNAKNLLASALILAVTTSAFAQEANEGSKHKTRAQVIAELQQAQADGSAATYGFLGSSVSYNSAANVERAQPDATLVASAPKSSSVSTK
jgi:hypothetical protein